MARYAVKCFTRAVPDLQQRYTTIAEHLATGPTAPWQVTFDYHPRGVLVAGHWWPTVVMEWVDDATGLAQYVTEHLIQPARLDRLATTFAQTCTDLHHRRIAHGDLQHGNILVTTDERIRLVDYDDLWVPALAGQPGIERGHPNYQSPHRRLHHTGPELDHFSSWVIYVSLLATATDPTLWHHLNGGDDCLLFRATDLRNPTTSPAFTALATSHSELARAAGDHLAGLCRLASPLHAPLLDPDQLPVPAELPEHRDPPTSPPSQRPSISIPAPRPPIATIPDNHAPPATISTPHPTPTPRPPSGTQDWTTTTPGEDLLNACCWLGIVMMVMWVLFDGPEPATTIAEQKRPPVKIGTITVGHGPDDVVFSPDGRHVYVTNFGSDSVSVIDTKRGVVTDTITVDQ